MIVFDTSFLLDYLDGVEATAEYLDEHEEKPFFAPTLALFEAYRGAARTAGKEGIERVAGGLDWVEPLPLEDPAAKEAALIEAELLDSGERVNLGDTLIAGVCRHHGARIVTRDSHFDRVDGLEVDGY
ncbi:MULTISPECIES: type II toxin-antitoxin system VapC family toxin [Haloarcula]|uniref:type II toxin-antitoxin system VapC family toxin n=1 Tax=Haloarcula TaxID=2237 RepID=UPI000F8F042C|nr:MULTISPECIES: type II toxin-antitoxin system VapC family toxin [Haloarcula]NHX42001.1 type II toxin-antitoxin system VapC family toxin [Haloarcula sp. R1-2]